MLETARTELGSSLRACESQEEARQAVWLNLVETYSDIEETGLFEGYFDYLDTIHDTIHEMKEKYREMNFDGENPFA